MSVVLVTQHAMRMRLIILPSRACVAVPFFSALSRKQRDLRGKKVAEGKMCFFFYDVCLKYISF
jgi:hypothetical protein